MVVGIRAADLDRFIPNQRVSAQLRLPVKLDKVGLARLIHQTERMNAEPCIMR